LLSKQERVAGRSALIANLSAGATRIERQSAFDGNGNIIGVVVATLDAAKVYQAASAIPQNVNLAINADYLLSLVAASERFSWVADYWRSHRKRPHNARRLSALGDVRWWD